MSMIWKLLMLVGCSLLAISDFASAGRNFSGKRWGWFGVSTFLAIYWTALAIHTVIG